MRLRVLSYNIHKAVGMDRKFSPERIAAVLRHHDADIVLLQEVDRHAPRSRHMELAAVLARALEVRYTAVGINVSSRGGKYGNATLSRFPISRTHNIDLTIGHRKRRGAQHTRIHLLGGFGGATLDVFNIHLALVTSMQRTQVERLLSAQHVASLDASQPCLIAGDMNDWTGRLWRQFLRHGFHCATNRRPGSRWSIRTYPSFAPAGGLDKIFYRGAALRLIRAHRSRLGLARIASDHLPIIADFAYEP